MDGWNGGMLEGGHEEAESGGSLRGKQNVGSDELGWVRFASDSFVWVRGEKRITLIWFEFGLIAAEGDPGNFCR